MKTLLPIADCRPAVRAHRRGRLPIARQLGGEPGALAVGGAHGVTRPTHSIENRKSKIENGFTMVEIAICLAIIGIALIAIIGVLPLGINVQKDNREETIIDQDYSVFMENIRNGSRGLDDLTNYVYAISNSWASFNINGTETDRGSNFYTYAVNPIITTPYQTGSQLTNGANIIGLMSTPEYTDPISGAPIPSLIFGGISNHVVAYVRAISGPAVEKPPQNNPTILSGTFSYKILCDNVPVAVDTNLFFQHPRWQPKIYTTNLISNPADFPTVFYNWTYWRAIANTSSGDEPGFSAKWAQVPDPNLELIANLRELRLTFLWPLLPNGRTGIGHHTFATTVAGQMVTNTVNPVATNLLYFFQPQSFANAP